MGVIWASTRIQITNVPGRFLATSTPRSVQHTMWLARTASPSLCLAPMTRQPDAAELSTRSPDAVDLRGSTSRWLEVRRWRRDDHDLPPRCLLHTYTASPWRRWAEAQSIGSSVGRASARQGTGAGRPEDARQRAEQALTLSRDYKQRSYEAYVLRLLGEVAGHRVPPEIDQAEAFYHQALALADELGMRPLLAHCYYGLGILYNRIGRPEPARIELAAAIELYRAMEMTFWLERAELALVQEREREN